MVVIGGNLKIEIFIAMIELLRLSLWAPKESNFNPRSLFLLTMLFVSTPDQLCMFRSPLHQPRAINHKSCTRVNILAFDVKVDLIFTVAASFTL
jgi:hypothetical protein